MHLAFIGRLFVVACIAAFTTGQSFGCKCSGGFQEKNSWALAKQHTDRSAAVFEGIPERFELQWNLLNAKEGELISADDLGPNNFPRMLITFRVQKAYKGDLGQTVQVKTGLGGGDCGAVFSPGLTYLVFAGMRADLGLEVGMCSPGGWVGAGSTAVELRYLRKEHPINSDLAPSRRWSGKGFAEQEEKRRNELEAERKRYDAATGKICGTIVSEKTKDGSAAIVSFLPTAGHSPAAYPTTSVNPDNSFCSEPLGPGKYYLYFTRTSQERFVSGTYYPGVPEVSKAIPLDVSPGQTQSDIVFKIPTQSTYSVRGLISTNDKSGLNSNSVYITLLNLDDLSIYNRHIQPIDFQGSFPLPNTRYFHFDDVLPGHYAALVSVLGRGWLTRKVEVNVTTHMKFISLELIHKQ
jgi:hypothetical protein